MRKLIEKDIKNIKNIRKDTKDNFVFFRFVLSKDINPSILKIHSNNHTYDVHISNQGTYQIYIPFSTKIYLEHHTPQLFTQFEYLEKDDSNLKIIDYYKNIYLVQKPIINYLPDDINTYIKNIEFRHSRQITNAFRLVLENIQNKIKKSNNDFIEDILNIDTLINKAYNININYPQNWWDYEIGIPKAIMRILVLIYDHLEINNILYYLDIIYRFSPKADIMHYRWDERKQLKSTGANLTDLIEITNWRYIFHEDYKLLKNNFKLLIKVFDYVKTGDGFYKDGSFIQHDYVAYNGAYGEVLLTNISYLMTTFLKSNIKINKVLDKIFTLIKKHFLPFIFNGYFLDTLRGRSISRSNNTDFSTASRIINAILRLSLLFDNKRKNIIIRLISENIHQEFQIDDDLKDIILLNKELKKTSLTRSYNQMNQYVYQSKNHFFGVSLSSKNILTHEYMNGENKKGWYFNLGYTPLYIGPKSIYEKGYYPTINPYYLSGVTNSNKEISLDEEGLLHLNQMTFGLTLSNQTWIHFDLNSPFDQTKANKSYLLFEQGLLQIVSNVNSNLNVHTTIYNLTDVDLISKNEIIFGGKSLNILSNQELVYETEKLKGSYKDINDFESTTPYEKTYYKAYAEHKDNHNLWYMLTLKTSDKLPKVIVLQDDIHVVNYLKYTYINIFNDKLYESDILIEGTGNYILFEKNNQKQLWFKTLNQTQLSNIKITKSNVDYEILSNNKYKFSEQNKIIKLTYEV
ncbi:polysaccharide lyase family 8 super-sandwich domain-containing protein [Acholeplasma granularum]|uniref:polysaccharide lyase family 8 super-sandwich domain-containing protein n=1 Tax=Acholeplasma granularum TaxID=264635 RepID=UPI00046F7DF3|nr:polysaccharide lyase family 8 super-sandwich domain-containing protein [Acholeplasma granularum]